MPGGIVYPIPLSQADIDAAAQAAASAAAANAVTNALAAVAAAGYAKTVDVPLPATAMPPGVGVDGDKGTGQKYALSDHTHATSVQRIRMTIATGQTVRWTFTKSYDPGVIPVVTGTAQNTATITSSTQPFIVNIVGVPTNTYVDIVVFQARAVPQNLVTLLTGAVYSLFTTPPAGTIVNLQAAKPTQ